MLTNKHLKEGFLSIPGQARSHRHAISSHSLAPCPSPWAALLCPGPFSHIQMLFGESAQFLTQVIIPVLDFVRNSICALRQPPLNSNHAGVTNQKSTLSLSEGLIYNLLLSDLKLTKSGEQRKQNHTSIQHRQARTSHQTYSQSTKSHAGSHDENTNIWNTKTVCSPKDHQLYRNILQWELSRRALDTEFKRIILNAIKQFKEFKEGSKKHLNSWKMTEISSWLKAQKAHPLHKTTNTAQDLKSEFNKEEYCRKCRQKWRWNWVIRLPN